MLALAEQARWEALDAVSAERGMVQRTLLSVQHETTDFESLGRCLERCLDLNQQIAVLVGRARQETAESLQRIRVGEEAVTAYRNAEELAQP
jgi:hypothetical protein